MRRRRIYSKIIMSTLKKILSASLISVFASVAIGVSLAHAQTSCDPTIQANCPTPPPNSSIALSNPLGTNNSTVEDLLHSIVNWLITIATPIAVGMILIGAFQMIFAGGNPERFATGRKTILYTAIGYAIIVIGWGMVSIIRDILNVP